MKKNGILQAGIAVLSLWVAQAATADGVIVEVPMHQVAQVGFGKAIGKITLQDSKYGLLITPNLKGLTPAPGTRGFHVHEVPNCDNFGLAAQGHLDPEKKNKHLGPYSDDGTLGDLPSLIVDANGTATLPVLAPRLTLKMIEDHSLVIHMGADNYSEVPDKNGGAGDRYACGIIPVVPPGTPSGTNSEGIQVPPVTTIPDVLTTPNTTPTGAPPSSTTTPIKTPTPGINPAIGPTSSNQNSLNEQSVESLLKRKRELQQMQQQTQNSLINQGQKKINLALPPQASAQLKN